MKKVIALSVVATVLLASACTFTTNSKKCVKDHKKVKKLNLQGY